MFIYSIGKIYSDLKYIVLIEELLNFRVLLYFFVLFVFVFDC